MSTLPNSNILLVNPTILQDETTRKTYEQLNQLLLSLSSVKSVVIPTNMYPFLFTIVKKFIEHNPKKCINFNDHNRHYDIMMTTLPRHVFADNFMSKLFDPQLVVSPFFKFRFYGNHVSKLDVYSLILEHNFQLFFKKKGYTIKSCKIHKQVSGCVSFWDDDYDPDYDISIQIKVVPNNYTKKGKYNVVYIGGMFSLNFRGVCMDGDRVGAVEYAK